jgi:uncharacterized protein YbbC (DUF1343 family)
MNRRRFLTTIAAAAAGSAAAGSAPLAAASGASAPGSPGQGRGRQVLTGFDVLAASGYEAVRGEKVGIVTNPTGILRDLTHEVDVMAASDEVDLIAVFGPEHGFRGTAQAGGSEGFYIDPRTGLPVYDTYLKSGQALANIFTQSGVDTILFDIQDAGARFYTYIWTMYDCMEAAVLAGKRFVVLDRPNPVSGREATGPVMHPQFATFVGRKAISQQHGMTVAELASLFNAEFVPAAVGAPADLDVVPMRGWTRDMLFADTGLPWVLPSPNMPTPDTALVYPGTCMFEGLVLSEGRGTTRPFELIGAPGIDGGVWADALNDLGLPGVGFREAYFTPSFSKHVNKACGGVQVHLMDPAAIDSVRVGTEMIIAVKRLFPAQAGWRPDNWIDRLTGSTRFRTMVDAGAGADEVVAGWQEELAAFAAKREQHLIYKQERRQGLTG